MVSPILCLSDTFSLPFLSAGFSTSPFLELSLPLRKHFKVCLKNNILTDFTGFFPLFLRTGREKARLNFLCEMMCGVSEQNKGQAVVLEEPSAKVTWSQASDSAAHGVPRPLPPSLGSGFPDMCWERARTGTEHSTAHRSSAPFIQSLTTEQEGAPTRPGLALPFPLWV